MRCIMRSIGIVVPVFVLAITAFGQDVRYNFASGEDFSKFRTYKWVQFKDAAQLNQLADEQLKSAVNAELAKKGLTPTTAEDADLYIGYQAAIGQEKQLTTFNSGGTGWGYGPGWGS